MKVKLMTRTGFVVSDLEQALEFYRDVLGLKVTRSGITEGEFNSQALGFDAPPSTPAFLTHV